MQEKKAAKAAAKKQQQEKARISRATNLAAKAAAIAAEQEEEAARAVEEDEAARAAQAESAGWQPVFDPQLSNGFLGPATNPLHLSEQNPQAGQFRDTNRDATGHSRFLNGSAQQAQHDQQAQHSQHVQHHQQAEHAQHSQHGSDWDHTKQPNGLPARRNGYHLPDANQHDGQLTDAEGQFAILKRQAWEGGRSTGQEGRLSTADQDIDIMYRSPQQAFAHAGSAQTSPEIDIIHTSSGGRQRCSSRHMHQQGTGTTLHSALQNSAAGVRSLIEPDARHDTIYHLQHQPLKAETTSATCHMPSQLAHSSDSGQLLSESQASQSDAKRLESEEADDTFDWEAWMSPEQKRQGIAERLQRPRRPPKRPYPLLDPSKPKPKKHQSLKGSSHHPVRLQHRLPDRLARHGSRSTCLGLDPESAHASGQGQYAHTQTSGLALPSRAAANRRAAKGRSKGRRALETVGCIRAAAYQGEAFMQARMDVLEQQGVLPGNQAPADADSGHQVSHSVTLVVVMSFIKVAILWVHTNLASDN